MAWLLVTGGAGFIGSNFTRMAVTRGYDVRVLDTLTYAGDRENLWGPSGDGRSSSSRRTSATRRRSRGR